MPAATITTPRITSTNYQVFTHPRSDDSNPTEHSVSTMDEVIAIAQDYVGLRPVSSWKQTPEWVAQDSKNLADGTEAWLDVLSATDGSKQVTVIRIIRWY